MRRLAGVGVHPGPAAAVVVEQLRHARPGLLGEATSGAHKRPVDGVAALAMVAELPDAGQLFARRVAHALTARGDPLHSDRRDEREQRHRPAHRQGSPSPDRIVAENLEQRAHRRISRRRILRRPRSRSLRRNDGARVFWSGSRTRPLTTASNSAENESDGNGRSP